jgi:hypothetical protein
MQLLFHQLESILDLHLDILLGFDQRIVYERVQERHYVALILSHHSHDHLAALLEDTFLLKDSKSVHDIRGKSEWDYLWDLKFGSLLKDTIKVDMSNLARVLVNQYVVSMSISQTNHVANHGPNSG